MGGKMTRCFPKRCGVWCSVGFALTLLSGTLSSCLNSNVCGKEMIESNGLCVLPPDSETKGEDSDTVPLDLDAGDSENEMLPGGLGEACTSNGDCLGEADYCLLKDWPDPNGICTLQDCNLEVDDCPTGWECLDLAAYSPIPVQLPTACAPLSTAERHTVNGEGGAK